MLTFGFLHSFILRGGCYDRRIEPVIRIAGNSTGLMMRWDQTALFFLAPRYSRRCFVNSLIVYIEPSRRICLRDRTAYAISVTYRPQAGRYYMCTAHIILTTGKTFSLIPSNSKKWSATLRLVSMFINSKRLKAMPLSFEIRRFRFHYIPIYNTSLRNNYFYLCRCKISSWLFESPPTIARIRLDRLLVESEAQGEGTSLGGRRYLHDLIYTKFWCISWRNDNSRKLNYVCVPHTKCADLGVTGASIVVGSKRAKEPEESCTVAF